jgi:hypothetical protein
VGEQRVAGIAVVEVRARVEVQPGLAADQIENVLLGSFVHLPPPGQTQQRPLVAQAARVVEEVPQGDALRARGHAGHVTRDMISEGKLAGVLEHEHSPRRELLGQRGDVEHRIRHDLRAVLEIGHAVSLCMNDLAVLHHTHRIARQVGIRPVAEERVDLSGVHGHGG